MDAQLVLFEDDTVVIDTGMLTPAELEKEYGVKVTRVKDVLDLGVGREAESWGVWPTDRGMSWK